MISLSITSDLLQKLKAFLKEKVCSNHLGAVRGLLSERELRSLGRGYTDERLILLCHKRDNLHRREDRLNMRVTTLCGRGPL